MKVIFFGSDDFALAHLQALHASEHEVVLCVTQPDRPRHRGHKMVVSPLKEFSIAQNIEVFQPTDFKDVRVADELQRFDADLFVVIAYGRILPDRILTLPKLYSINVHGSLLPSYRGAAPINWAVMNGDHETGLTIIRMNARMDAGDIIAQKKMSDWQSRDFTASSAADDRDWIAVFSRDGQSDRTAAGDVQASSRGCGVDCLKTE